MSEKLGIGNLVQRHKMFTLGEYHAFITGEAIGGVNRSAGLATSRAKAVMDHLKWFTHDKVYRVTQATAANTVVGGWRAGLVVIALR